MSHSNPSHHPDTLLGFILIAEHFIATIASQKLSTEIEQPGDFEYAYDEFIKLARKAADDIAAVRRSPAAKMGDETFSFKDHLQRQREWSEKTFGPGPRTAGVIDHIRKELNEIEAAPSDVSEWIDVVILGLDGAWRAGHSPQQIIEALVAKQTKNEGRSWPDWRTAPPDKAIEHTPAALAAMKEE